MALIDELVEDEADIIPEAVMEEEVEGAEEISEVEQEVKEEGEVVRPTSQEE
jgi:hypothetical protein